MALTVEQEQEYEDRAAQWRDTAAHWQAWLDRIEVEPDDPEFSSVRASTREYIAEARRNARYYRRLAKQEDF